MTAATHDEDDGSAGVGTSYNVVHGVFNVSLLVDMVVNGEQNSTAPFPFEYWLAED